MTGKEGFITYTSDALIVAIFAEARDQPVPGHRKKRVCHMKTSLRAHSTINLPFVIWMMRGFFQELPIELEESAQVDGCSRLGSFLRIAVPLTAPGLAATTILCVLFSWDEFLFSVVLTDVNTRTLPVTISGFIGAVSVDWGGSSAAATIIMVPMIVMGLLVQKHPARGLTLGAVKG